MRSSVGAAGVSVPTGAVLVVSSENGVVLLLGATEDSCS